MTHCPWWNKWRGKGTFYHCLYALFFFSSFSNTTHLLFSSLLLDVSWFRSYSHFSSIESDGTGHSSNNCTSKQASLIFFSSSHSSRQYFCCDEWDFFFFNPSERNSWWTLVRLILLLLRRYLLLPRLSFQHKCQGDRVYRCEKLIFTFIVSTLLISHHW